MTGEKIKAVTAEYREYLDKYGYKPHEVDHEMYAWQLNSSAPARHVRYMLDQIDRFVDEGRIDKAFRWLGFAQGVLWTTGFYTLDELKEHNRP